MLLGDLLTSLLLARLHQQPDDLAAAISQAVAALQAVLSDTAKSCGEEVATAQRSSEVSRQPWGHTIHPFRVLMVLT